MLFEPVIKSLMMPRGVEIGEPSTPRGQIFTQFPNLLKKHSEYDIKTSRKNLNTIIKCISI